jgi:hypothetical protein
VKGLTLGGYFAAVTAIHDFETTGKSASHCSHLC